MKFSKIFSQSSRLGTGILCFLLSTSLNTTTHAQSDYYWSDNHKIDLNEDKSSLILQFKAGSNIQSYFTQPINQLADVEIHTIKHRAILKFKTSHTVSLQDLIKQLNIPSDVLESASFGLKLNDGFQLWSTNNVVLQLRKDASISDINGILKEFNATVTTTKYNRTTIHVDDISQALPLANALYKEESVVWAHPDFYTPIKHHLTPSDTYYGNQFQMNNSNDIDCDAPEAWDITRGSSNIRVAVIDDGVETHQDLTTLNTSLGHSPINNGNGTPNASGAHGVACAGIVAASHNGIGVAGVAPNVELFSVNIFLGGETGNDLANSISYAKNNGADVLSNSWGFPNACNYSIDALNSALADAKNTGRNGKGCVIVFASGNDGNTCVSYPGNNPNVIAVGAITNTGNRASYSNRGSSLDISAPSNGGTASVYTTDRQGSAGYASGNYTSTFGGTSAACPLVSGVAALVLSTNGNLTSAQVQSILETTADDMGTSGFDVSFGHGRVNAHQAVLAAGGNSGGGGGGGGGTPTPSCVGNNVTLTLVTDNYGSETSWTLTNSSGATVESGSGYANNQTYTYNWNLADGNYTFTINDSYGDGICCSYGNGSYSLVSGSDNIKSGGSFTSSEATNFCTTGGSTGGGGGGTPACPAIDLSASTINAYGNGQDNGSGSVSNGVLTLANNAWKYIDYNYTVTANTVVEFEFYSTSQGEIQGLGFDTDNGISSNRTFRVYGSQNWGVGNYNDYSNAGSWKTYTIPVGQFYTGAFDRLFFVCDDDANNGGNASFRNVKVYESGACASSSFTPALFNGITAIQGTEAETASTSQGLTLYPNPTTHLLNVQLEQVQTGTRASIMDATGRLVWSNTITETLTQINTQAFAAGIYNLTITSADGTITTKRFVKK